MRERSADLGRIFDEQFFKVERYNYPLRCRDAPFSEAPSRTSRTFLDR